MMKYVLADKEKAAAFGFGPEGRKTTGGKIWLNEKEMMNNPVLTGALETRAAQVGGRVYNQSEAAYMIREGRKNKE